MKIILETCRVHYIRYLLLFSGSAHSAFLEETSSVTVKVKCSWEDSHNSAINFNNKYIYAKYRTSFLLLYIVAKIK